MKNIIFNLFNRIGFVAIGRLIAFISVPIISRALGPEQYGIYNLVFAIAGYAFLAANWGFLAKGIRDVSKNQENKHLVVEPILSARLTLWWVGGVITMLLCLIVFKFSNLNLYIFLAILTNLGVAASIDFYFYGCKDTLTPSLSNLIGQVIFLVLVWFFIHNENDLLILMIINIFYRIIESLIMLFVFKRKYSLQISFFSNKAIPLLKENFLLGLGSKASFFQASFPLVIIPILLNVHDLGIFSATFKLFLVISLLVQSINLVFSPWIVESRNVSINKRKKLFRNLFIGYSLIGLISASIMFLIGPYIMDILFGEEFQETQKLIIVFSVFFAPILPIQLLLANFMNNFENDKHYFIGAIIQSLLTLIGVPLFIQIYGLNGVIYALALSSLTVCIYYLFRLKRNLNAI